MRRVATLLVALAIAAIVLIPIALLLKQAFTSQAESLRWPPTWLPAALTLDNFRIVWSTFELVRGLWMSWLVALLATVSTLAVCVAAAWAAARRPTLDRPLQVALVVTGLFPSISLAVPLAVILGHWRLYDQPSGVGLWLAHTLIALPLAFFILRSGFRSVSVDLEEAARIDGATRLGAFCRVTLPLIRPSLAAAALLVFLVSWGDLAYALVLQPSNRPLSPLLYFLTESGQPDLASALAVIILVPALLITVILEPIVHAAAFTGSNR